MDEIIDIKTFEILKTTTVNNSELPMKSIRLLAVFGNLGSEVIYATADDQVYGFGQNKNGCLGLSTYERDIREPRLNRTLSGKGLKDIVYGFEHCIGLTADGKCYGWGHNDSGRLGIGTYDAAPTPQLVKELDNQIIAQLVCGGGHTLALTITGQVLKPLLIDINSLIGALLWTGILLGSE